MIQKEFLEIMIKEQLNTEFNRDIEVMMNYYANPVIFHLAVIYPSNGIDDLFDEMKQIWLKRLALELKNGYIAIENISNFERMDREKYEQRLSGILSGKYK
ncbi:TPA: hypothetical protein ACWLUR_002498 [Enterococcus faecalis]|nr:hypothetical protein [Enterococcus faecalis]